MEDEEDEDDEEDEEDEDPSSSLEELPLLERELREDDAVSSASARPSSTRKRCITTLRSARIHYISRTETAVRYPLMIPAV